VRRVPGQKPPVRGARRPRLAARTLVATFTLLGAARLPAETFLLPPRSDVIGSVAVVQAAYEDTLTDIARRAGLGYEDMVLANPGVDPWLPGDGTEVVLPIRRILPAGARRGLIVNVAEFRLYYFYDVGGQPAVATFPISIGKMDWSTPLGLHAIIGKTYRPTWRPPESIRQEHAADGDPLPVAIPPGPDNPLGDYAMRLSFDGYLIHGTNKPVGIGMQVTHGCVRMYPEDIEWLYPRVAVRTPVLIVNQSIKFGWQDDDLYIEVRPPLERSVPIDEPHDMTDITALLVRMTANRPASVDWDLITTAYHEKRGIPVRVGRASAPAQKVSARTARISRR
jgi:L,D-transpeptidase ErfK/SrfK